MLAATLAGCGGDSDGASPQPVARTRAIFALVEPPDVNLYSSELDGSDRTLLVSRPLPQSSARSSLVSGLDAAVSPDGRQLAYRFPFLDRELFVIDLERGGAPRTIATADSFAYAPDSRRLLLGRRNAYTGPEAPWFGPASTWTLQTIGGPARTLDVGDSGANELGGWIDATRVLLVARSAYGGIGQRLYVLDVDSGALTEVPLRDGVQLGDFAADRSGASGVTLLPPEYGSNYSCDIYPLRGTELGAPFVNVPASDCRGLAWNGDDELWHGRGTGPHGRIDVTDTNAFGYYVLSAIYRYRVSLDRDEPVIESDGISTWDLGGVLPGRAIAVVEHRPDREIANRLEIRDLGGGGPRLLASNRYDVGFIGWSEYATAGSP